MGVFSLIMVAQLDLLELSIHSDAPEVLSAFLGGVNNGKRQEKTKKLKVCIFLMAMVRIELTIFRFNIVARCDLSKFSSATASVTEKKKFEIAKHKFGSN